MFERIENLKRQLTDKRVVVTGGRPELARFEGHVGQVKTVNMSGRALVQFDAWNNTGWYDIEIEFLRVLSEAELPATKPAKPSLAAAPKAERAAPAVSVVPASETASASPAKKLSTAEILAAARAKREAAGTASPVKKVTHEAGHEAPVVKRTEKKPESPSPLAPPQPAEPPAGEPTPAPGSEAAKPLTTAEKIALLRKSAKPPGV